MGKLKGNKAKKGVETKKKTSVKPDKEDDHLKEQSLDDFLQEWSDNEEEEDQDEGQQEDSSEDEEDNEQAQKQYLSSLHDKDPEFYQFLAENDKELLNFDAASSDDEEEKEDQEALHQPPSSLELASDDSDYEEEEEESSSKKKNNVLSKSTISDWSTVLKSKPTVKIVSEVCLAFRSALSSLDDQGGQKKEVQKSKWKVTNSSIFNAIIKLCLDVMEPSLTKLLGSNSNQMEKSKNWKPLNKWVKGYTLDLTKLLANLTEPSVLSALLRHVHNLVPFYAKLPKSSKNLLKVLVHLWSSHQDESVRVLAFVSIIKLARKNLSENLDPTIKAMYMAYVRNSKFTSPNTWPMIHFMRRSLAEVFLLDQSFAYKHAFVYVRQLTIHLRNAIMHSSNDSNKKKKESPLQTVYNWQFVHSIHLWIQVLGDSHPSDILEPLIYPVVQLITGTIRLNYTSKYYPLRFHLANLLVDLSSATGKFVPILPYYLDVLNQFKSKGKNHNKKLSMKPMDWSCVLKLSKSQLNETSYEDTVIEQVYYGLLNVLASNGHKISFPEMVVPALNQIKAFLKQSRVASHSKKMKTVVEKANENANFVANKRKSVGFTVKDLEKIRDWEGDLKIQGTPLTKWYVTFKAAKQTDQMKRVSRQQELDDYKFVPKLSEMKKKKKQVTEFKGIFDDEEEDEEDEMSDEERFRMKEERGKKRKEEVAPKEEKKVAKKAKVEKVKVDDDDEDEEDKVEDFNLDDLSSDDIPDDEVASGEEDDEDNSSDDDDDE